MDIENVDLGRNVSFTLVCAVITTLLEEISTDDSCTLD